MATTTGQTDGGAAQAEQQLTAGSSVQDKHEGHSHHSEAALNDSTRRTLITIKNSSILSCKQTDIQVFYQESPVQDLATPLQ